MKEILSVRTLEWVAVCPTHGKIGESDNCDDVLYWQLRCCGGYRVVHRDTYIAMETAKEARKAIREAQERAFKSGKESIY